MSFLNVMADQIKEEENTGKLPLQLVNLILNKIISSN